MHYGTRSYSINLDQPLFNWSAFQTLAQSHRQVAQAEAQLRSAEQSLIARTAAAYFAVLAAEDTLRADKEAQDAYKAQIDQAQQKYAVGLTAVTDVRNAQGSYDGGVSALIADQIQLDNTRRALTVITGTPANQIATLQDEFSFITPQPESVEDWSQQALLNNPDLMTAHFAAEVARKQIDIDRGKYLPTLSATGSLGRQTTTSELGEDAVTDVVGLTLNLNLYQGGFVQSQVRQARASYEQSLAQYELERRTVDQQPPARKDRNRTMAP